MKGIILFVTEMSRIVPKSSKKSKPVTLSGQIINFQLCICTDHYIGQLDEEDALESIRSQEFDEKRYTILQMSCEFQDSNADVNDLCIMIGSSAVAAYGAEISGKYLLHPLQVRYRSQNTKNLFISDIDIDLSLSQSVYFQELFKQFSQIMPQNAKNNPNQHKSYRIDLKIEIQQILLSISHDFTISRHLANTYFMLQFDSPNIILSSSEKLLSLSTVFAFYYYNQQLFDWEPFIENFRVDLDYILHNGQKILKLSSVTEFNLNFSYSFITTCSNFLKGFEQKDYFTHLGLLAKSKMQVKWGSGYSIKNETGQQIKC